MTQNLKMNWLVISKLTWGIWLILTRALESLKKCHFNVLLLRKVYIVWAKKVQRHYLSWNWRGIQNLERNHLMFQNWHKEFGKFWPEHLKASKIFNLMEFSFLTNLFEFILPAVQNLPRLFLMDNIKMDIILTKIKWKIHSYCF